MSSALFSMLISLAVTRILGASQAGVFAIAWAAAQLMQSVGWFSMRQFQVSDVEDQFDFRDYLSSKVLTCAAMLAGGFLYAGLYGYSAQKVGLTFLLCCFMTADVFAGCVQWFFQHKSKLHLAGKSYVVRIWTSIFCDCGCFVGLWKSNRCFCGRVWGFRFVAFGLRCSSGSEIRQGQDSVSLGAGREDFLKSAFRCFRVFLLIFIMNVSKMESIVICPMRCRPVTVLFLCLPR